MPARSRSGAMLVVATLGALVSAPAAAQARADSGRAVCFGVSFDRGCRLMLQYEAVHRGAAAGRTPRLERTRPRDRSDRSQLFVAGGMMFRASPSATLGAIYDVGTGDENGTRAFGLRWGRHLRTSARLDVTAGAVFLPLVGDSVDPSHIATSRGAFAEVALHGSNALTLIVRDERYARRADARGGNLVFAGARAEATPAALLSLVVAALIGLAGSATGPNW